MNYGNIQSKKDTLFNMGALKNKKRNIDASKSFCVAVTHLKAKHGLEEVRRIEGVELLEAMQQFARSLKQFVQSREYMEQRRLTQLLKDAQRLAIEIKDSVRATHEIGHTLHLTSAKLASLSQFRLHDPGRDRVAVGPLVPPARLGR